MAKYRKKPVVIKAYQWFKNGDHPDDYKSGRLGFENGVLTTFSEETCKQESFEGQIVRYYRDPFVSGENVCKMCNQTMHIHGWVDTLEGGHIVCPGDFIITGIKGEHYPCKPDIFAATYEMVEE